MNRYLAETVGVLTSYGYSILSYANEVNMLGTMTAGAGAFLTVMMAIEAYRRAQGQHLDNQIKRKKLLENE